ncbi:MAG: S8 family serine peptidase [Candidatus Absconditabacteria bacterium]
MLKYNKQIIAATLASFCIFGLALAAPLQGSTEKLSAKQNYVAGELLVKFKSTSTLLKSSALKIQQNSMSAANVKQIETINNNTLSVVQIQDGKSVLDKVQELKTNPNVEYAEPNYIYYTQSFNDTSSGALWGLSQISGYQAFTIFSGDANPNTTGTIVAVLDVGVAYDHPDLINQMRNGVNCKDGNGNALGSCLHGYDFADNDNNPSPVRSTHGTHIAGIIAAQANNMKGVIGTNFNAKIMGIRAGDENGFTTSAIIKGIDFARQNGAKVINASFGGPGYSTPLYDAINAFRTAGGIFVAAAGNSATDHITTSSYPCDYNLDNIICVAATDASDTLANFSDYGSTGVDVAAPGVDIYSTFANIVETPAMIQTFESVSLGAITNGWTTGGTTNTYWGIGNIGGGWGNVLYGDMHNYPYANNTNSYIQTGINLSTTSGVTIDFWSMCDTQYTIDARKDYMSFEVSSDGANWVEIGKWDEAYFDTDTNEAGVTYGHLIYDLTGQYLTNNFTFRFRRVTDGSDNNYGGCVVDDVVVNTYKANTTPELYGYMSGTSMATPYVAGLASLARSMRPELDYQTIKSVILGSGDTFSSLAGKTVSGKRINAYNTLLALNPLPTLSQIHITSNNTHTGYAKNGDTILLSFTGSTNLAAVSAKINGYDATISGSNTYRTASIITTGSMAETGVSFEINYQNIFGTTGLVQTGTTDGSKVIIDTTSPSLTITTLSGSVTGNIITIQGTGSDANGLYQLIVSGVVLSGSENRNHIVSLQPGLNTIVITGIDYAGNISMTSIEITRIPDIYDVKQGGTTVLTGYVSLSGSTTTGTVVSGTLQIYADTSNNYLQMSGLTIQTASGLWDGIVNPPVSSTNPSLGVNGLPVSSDTSKTRVVLSTIKVGSTLDSLIASGGYFTVSFVVVGGVNGNIINLYRSEEGSIWSVNSPDTTCTLDANAVCTFRTDRLSYFTSVKETIVSGGCLCSEDEDEEDEDHQVYQYLLCLQIQER